jgi:hypothetical protein
MVMQARLDAARAMGEGLVASTAHDAIPVVLLDDTPVIPDERHPWLTQRGTWGDLETLVLHWAAIGCGWVNLQFAVENGVTLVRYEANPDGEPLPDERLPAINGGSLSGRS